MTAGAASRASRRHRAPRAARSWARDEQGAFPVVEAILVAVLIFGAILFLGLSRRPTVDTSEGGSDLDPLAADTLELLLATDIQGATFDEWFDDVMAGGATYADDVDAFIADILGDGVFYQLRLSNGEGELNLLPYQESGIVPRSARMAQSFITPQWSPIAPIGSAIIVQPGEAICGTVTNFDSVQGPNANANGPDLGSADSWASHWNAAGNTVPEWAMFGRWSVDADAGSSCPSATQFIVLPEDIPAADLPTRVPIALQLVVWTGG